MGLVFDIHVTLTFLLLAVSGAAQLIGDLVTGRVAETSGQSFNIPFDDGDGAGKYHFLADVLRWRAQTQPDIPLFTLLDNRVSMRARAHKPSRKCEVVGQSEINIGLFFNYCLVKIIKQRMSLNEIAV